MLQERCQCNAQVVEVIQEMVNLGEEAAAAQLLADIALRARTLACEIVIALVSQASSFALRDATCVYTHLV